MTADEITASLTLEQKANQMVMAACYDVSPKQMKDNCYGAILSVAYEPDYQEWQKMIDKFQKAAIKSEAGIPYFYGNDQVHGVYDCKGAVVFPHNIGMGAADDEDLTYRVGSAGDHRCPVRRSGVHRQTAESMVQFRKSDRNRQSVA